MVRKLYLELRMYGWLTIPIVVLVSMVDKARVKKCQSIQCLCVFTILKHLRREFLMYF